MQANASWRATAAALLDDLGDDEGEEEEPAAAEEQEEEYEEPAEEEEDEESPAEEDEDDEEDDEDFLEDEIEGPLAAGISRNGCLGAPVFGRSRPDPVGRPPPPRQSSLLHAASCSVFNFSPQLPLLAASASGEGSALLPSSAAPRSLSPFNPRRTSCGSSCPQQQLSGSFSGLALPSQPLPSPPPSRIGRSPKRLTHLIPSRAARNSSSCSNLQGGSPPSLNGSNSNPWLRHLNTALSAVLLGTAIHPGPAARTSQDDPAAGEGDPGIGADAPLSLLCGEFDPVAIGPASEASGGSCFSPQTAEGPRGHAAQPGRSEGDPAIASGGPPPPTGRGLNQAPARPMSFSERRQRGGTPQGSLDGQMSPMTSTMSQAAVGSRWV
jgi:hypothetical protein